MMQFDHLADFAQCEAKPLRLFYEEQSLEISRIIRAVSGGRPGWFTQHAFAFIKADGLDIESRTLGEFANAHATL